ncbi:MAG: AtpZ/AtpI family protein [Patescibacteria group bacterium]
MKDNYLAISLRVLANLTAWIAGPVIIGVFLGKWLDNRYHTEPWLFLASIGFCFLISMYGLVTNALKEFKKIEIEADRAKKLKAEEDKLNKKIVEIK